MSTASVSRSTATPVTLRDALARATRLGVPTVSVDRLELQALVDAARAWQPAGPGDDNPGALQPGEGDAPQPVDVSPVYVSRIAEQVAEFHALIGSPPWPGPVAEMPADTIAVRNRLIVEEVREATDATSAGDIVGIADGLADLIYVAYGTAYTYGIDLDAVLAEVHRSNMSKEPGPTGKAVKGAAYSPPDVAGVLSRPSGWSS